EVRAPRRPEERLSLPPAMVTPTDPQLQRRFAREQKLLRELYARDSDPPAWDSFVLPVADLLGSPFGLRRILNGEPKSPHAGVDFRSPRGTEVAAAGHGRAVFVGDLYYSGLTVILDHGAGLFSIYAHLEEILCREQQPVERGAIVGRVGSTGRSTGPHLHWGVRLRGDRIDPLGIIRALTAQGP
ncbi:MAG: M23 family metallopeptidase, partial [Desulfuromonadales bacterium]|nr:M23 family metallopeptidase [Desulfuromonadales bacterium]